MDGTVEGVVDAIYFNQGQVSNIPESAIIVWLPWKQVCSAGSRVIVQESIADRLIMKIKERMGRLRVGDSLDKCMDMGPIVDASQVKSIDHYVQQAKEEGAEVLCVVMKLLIYLFHRYSNAVLAYQIAPRVIFIRRH